MLKRLKIEISSDLLHFAKAECDSIDSLEHYRGNCEPCFHFYGAGQMVAVIRGCDAPVIERTIRQQVGKLGSKIKLEIVSKKKNSKLFPKKSRNRSEKNSKLFAKKNSKLFAKNSKKTHRKKIIRKKKNSKLFAKNARFRLSLRKALLSEKANE